MLINSTICIPVVNYFPDFGALVPESISDAALRCVDEFGDIFGAPAKMRKSQWGNSVIFLGLEVLFPDPSVGILLRGRLPDGKLTKWSQIARRHVRDGADRA